MPVDEKKLKPAKICLLGGRQLPRISRTIIILLRCWFCSISLFLNSRLGKLIGLDKIEPVVSTFIMGGLFGLAMIPKTSIFLLVGLSEESVVFTYFVSKHHVISWVLALIAYYTATVLLTDKAHLTVPKPFTSTNMHPKIWKGAQDFLLSHFDYFPVTCVPWAEDATLDPNRQYVFAGHPHGIHCWPLNVFALEGSPFDKTFPGLCGKTLVGLAATIIFKLPIVRELFLMMRYIDASRHVVHSCMLSGQSIFVCTGGERESMETKVGEDTVVLSNRKGFVRMALSHGADLVPVFGVGVSDLYTTYSFFGGMRKKFQQTFGVALPIFHGRWGTPLPYRVPIRILVGEPIRTPTPLMKGGKVDPNLVDEYHQKYITALKEMHSKHVSDRTLNVI